ncbi:nucleotidyltransferase family protein [Aquimarina sp. 2304DJ70-9]|uniref:nucleotidyltransferase family protein n=1 Tax=Aquimarina penaris TaxID=3231044 RepID=UPI003462656D
MTQKGKVLMSSLQEPKIAQIILAAGASSRMGEPKQLLPWHGTTLIGHAIKEALQVETSSVFVVLGAYYDLIYKEVCNFPVTILEHPNWKMGMGSSIRFGVKTATQDKLTFDAVLISLIDQPLIDAVHLEALISKYNANPESIVATDLGGRTGAPAIFPASCFDELSMLKSDYGARYIIEKHKDKTKVVTASGKGVDLDTKKEYQALVQGKFPS